MSSRALYLLDIRYDGEAGRALLKLYDEVEHKIVEIHDTSGHKPYLLTDLSPDEILGRYPEVVKHRGFDHFEVVEKYDALRDVKVKMTKVVARDPLSVGGTRRALREILKGHAWEARIKYHHCYTYDRGLVPGMPYRLESGELRMVEVEVPHNIIRRIEGLYGDDPVLLARALEWAKLFQARIPSLKRVAVDIEVYSPEPNRIPRPEEAPYPVIAVSLRSSDGLKKVLLLKRPELGEPPTNMEGVEFFDTEIELLRESFRVIRRYPLIVTFNGDNFDLPYLRSRAFKLGMPEDEVPIEWSPNADHARVKHAVHLDLYKFFTNRSMRVYAFGGKYREGRTLDEISVALLGEGKVQIDRPIPELSYEELAEYSGRDAELTYRLTEFNDELVLKLILLMMRISKLGIEDLTRHNISAWIRSLLYFEHRRRGYLIPNEEDLRSLKSRTDTRALIKGKKYMGAVVIDPLPGTFFNVIVVDFASLYPSVVKRWNLSYETVRCSHEECRSNRIPGLSHWVCRKRRGLMSEVVGFLRDFRVYIYKRLAREEADPVRRSQYDVVQSALKVFINASYGVFGAETFPLYCPPVAEATTALGRYLLTLTLKKALDLEIPVLYGDTDSLFLWNPPREKLKELIEWVSQELQIDLDVDKEYKWVAFSGRKKNYVGVLRDGRVDAKGIIGKKRNTPEFIKKLVADVIGLLKKADNVESLEEVTGEIKKVALNYYEMLRSRRIPLDELVFRVAITKPLASYVKSTPQHVKAARQLQRLGRRVEVGDVISFVKVRGGDGVKAVQLARIDEVDPEKYVEHVRTALEQILEALGTSFEEILAGTQLM